MGTHHVIEIPLLLFIFYDTLGKMKLYLPLYEVATIYYPVLCKLNRVFRQSLM